MTTPIKRVSWARVLEILSNARPYSEENSFWSNDDENTYIYMLLTYYDTPKDIYVMPESNCNGVSRIVIGYNRFNTVKKFAHGNMLIAGFTGALSELNGLRSRDINKRTADRVLGHEVDIFFLQTALDAHRIRRIWRD